MNDYVFRTCTMADLASYYELYRTDYLESYGHFNMTLDEVRGEWEMPNFTPERNVYAAFTADGQMVANLSFWDLRAVPVRPMMLAYVHPEHRGRGIGTRLTEWAMQTSQRVLERVPAEARVVLHGYSAVPDGCQLLEDFGFVETRQSLQMAIEFKEAPNAVQFPEGFRIVTMVDHPHLEDFVRVDVEAFRDHRGFVDEPLELVVARFQNEMEHSSSYDPSLFMLLMNGDEPAAVLFAYPTSEEDADKAWVASFGVLPEYRRRGLGQLFLEYAFHEFHKRGIPKAGLSVDGASLTGATRLYTRVGMEIFKLYHAYEYEIRAGIEISNQGQAEIVNVETTA